MTLKFIIFFLRTIFLYTKNTFTNPKRYTYCNTLTFGPHTLPDVNFYNELIRLAPVLSNPMYILFYRYTV